MREQDVARLSPLGHAHLNELGRYRFPMLDPDAGSGRGAIHAPMTASRYDTGAVNLAAVPTAAGVPLLLRRAQDWHAREDRLLGLPS